MFFTAALSANRKISGDSSITAVLKRSVCQPRTPTTARDICWTSAPVHRIDSERLGSAIAGLITRRSTSSSTCFGRADTWYFRGCLTRKPMHSKYSRTIHSLTADILHLLRRPLTAGSARFPPTTGPARRIPEPPNRSAPPTRNAGTRRPISCRRPSPRESPPNHNPAP